VAQAQVYWSTPSAQAPALEHGVEAHSSTLISQTVPIQPDEQAQVNEPMKESVPWVQVPSFWHGAGAHSSMSVAQSLPP
jgi:hypothetical protein